MIRSLPLALLLCTVGLPALAVEPAKWLEVEVLVFEPPASTQAGETWPEAAGVPAAGNAIDILAPGIVEALGDAATAEPITPQPATSTADAPAPADSQATPAEQPYQALPAQALRLVDAKQRLAAAGQRPLAHLAWRQPLTPAAQTLPLRIVGGDSYAQPLPPPSDPAEAPAIAAETLPTAEQPPTAPPLWQLDGLLRLSAEPALEFDADLVLRKPQTLPEPVTVSEAAAELAGTPGPSFHLYAVKSHKRLKPEEIHYLDHPLLGILVQLRPYERPTATANAAPAEGPPPADSPH